MKQILLLSIVAGTFCLNSFGRRPYYIEPEPNETLPAVFNRITGHEVVVPRSRVPEVIRDGSVTIISDGSRWTVQIDKSRLGKKDRVEPPVIRQPVPQNPRNPPI